MRRTRYFVLPDFGATAHMCQGQTLDAAFVDPLESWVSVNVEDAVKVYVMLSRVRLLANLVIMQPFSPWLFQQGSPPGPDILMKKLRGDIAPERATAAFEEAENDDSVLYVVLTGEGRFFCSGADVAGNKEDWGDHDDPPRVQEIKSVLSQQDPYDSNVRALCPSCMACNLTYLCCYCVRLGATWRCTTPGSISANHW